VHYTFNLRDVARVVSGVLLPPAATLAADGGAAARLWTHEALRVFGDRLTEAKDLEWLLDTLRGAAPRHFGTPLDSVLGHLVEGGGGGRVTVEHTRRLFFTDLASGEANTACALAPFVCRQWSRATLAANGQLGSVACLLQRDCVLPA
jgi:AAA+ lid domain